MKILALNGSHRGEAGLTQWLLNKIAEGAVQEGSEFETVALINKKINPCTGCGICTTEANRGHCIYEHEDDVQEIFAKMRAADILIYATPVYIFTISGIMKILLDRFNSTSTSGEMCLTDSGLFLHRVDKQICSKPFVVLTCCGNVENETTKNVLSYFRTFSKFLDAPIVGTLVRKTVGMLEDVKTNGIDKQKPEIQAVVNAYVQAGRELATQGRIKTQTEKQANKQILGIPFIDLLLKFAFVKKIVIEKERQKANKQR